MKLTVNGKVLESDAETLAALLTKLDYGDALVATALNGNFVAAEKRDAEPLNDGDKVEILAPMKGG